MSAAKLALQKASAADRWPTIGGVLGDRERSGAYASEQRKLLRAAVAAEVLTFSPYWREAAAEAGLRRPRSAGDLSSLAPRPLSALGPPDELVLRPSPKAVRKSGPRPLRRRLRRTRLGRRRADAARRILDPLYKPIHWLIEGDMPVGCTEADLVRLADLGRRSLELAGVTPNDAIVGLVPSGPTLSSWQLALGAREAGVPLAGLTPDASIEAVTLLGPTVLAGRPPELLRVLRNLSGTARSSVSTVLVITRAPMLATERAALRAAAGSQAVVVESWAPPGSRALWIQCRGGDGVHTWPQAELLEVCGADGKPVEPGAEGQLVWTGLGWRGTAFVRLATGVQGRLVEGACETCGRTTPRILDAHVPLAGRRAEPAAESDAESDAMAELGTIKETGPFESVRTVRPRSGGDVRARRPAAADDAGPAVTSTPAESIVLRSSDDEGIVISAVSKDEGVRAQPVPFEEEDDGEGVVRAVVKDPVAAPLVPPVPANGAVRPGDRVELDRLPPVPEVGPDASFDGNDDAWLPDTGEVDAWPAPVLASTDGLAAWQVEHRRRRGHDDELVVHLALADEAELAEVLVSLERAIGATQYVVSSEAALTARIRAAAGRRVVDRRSTGNGHDGSADASRAVWGR